MAFLTARIAIYALIAATFVGMAVAAYNNIYARGEDAERQRWRLREASRVQQLAEVIADEQAKQASDHNKQISVLNKALTDAQQNLNNLRSVADKRLHIPARKSRECVSAVSSKVKDTSERSSAASRERLPRKIEEGLWRLAEDAQRVVIQYEQCRAILSEVAEIDDGR